MEVDFLRLDTLIWPRSIGSATALPVTRPTIRPSKSNTQDPESPLAEELSSFGKEIIGASQHGHKFESGCAYRAFEGRRGLECYYACPCLDFLDETIIPLRCAENSMSELSKLGILQILLMEMPVSRTDNNILSYDILRYLGTFRHLIVLIFGVSYLTHSPPLSSQDHYLKIDLPESMFPLS